ncbi:hypothetical protein [Legionella fallonii]|uniref:Uncharacterized protein n=1 Tax=Legionella fallonii LLAP-10 TaxID=1212491 RepID=A0A098G0W3_9GAMM|nr:hypothetical protein [Legionella fallonii]CEG56108.1 protein of unknown function [Legionella fallonii LLAP-10]
MAAQEPIVTKNILFDRVIDKVNQPVMDLEGIEAFLLEELRAIAAVFS